MTAPTIHEIAAMPFPASRDAMRKFYNPYWGKDLPAEAEKRPFRATVRWEASGYATYDVEAYDEEEAADLAEKLFDRDDSIPADAEWDGCDVSERKSS